MLAEKEDTWALLDRPGSPSWRCAVGVLGWSVPLCCPLRQRLELTQAGCPIAGQGASSSVGRAGKQVGVNLLVTRGLWLCVCSTPAVPLHVGPAAVGGRGPVRICRAPS